MSWTGPAVIVACTNERAEQLLTNGDLRCPRCQKAEAARRWQVDVSTVIGIRRTVEAARAEIAQLTEAVKS